MAWYENLFRGWIRDPLYFLSCLCYFKAKRHQRINVIKIISENMVWYAVVSLSVCFHQILYNLTYHIYSSLLKTFFIWRWFVVIDMHNRFILGYIFNEEWGYTKARFAIENFVEISSLLETSLSSGNIKIMLTILMRYFFLQTFCLWQIVSFKTLFINKSHGHF